MKTYHNDLNKKKKELKIYFSEDMITYDSVVFSM